MGGGGEGGDGGMSVTRDLSPSQLLLLSWCFMSRETIWCTGDRQTFIANSYGVHMAPMCNCINQHLYMHICTLKSQTFVAIPLFEHMKIQLTLVGMGTAGLGLN